MTLVDTSVWVRHFRLVNAKLLALLDEESVGVHPFVTGEIACGNLGSRDRTLFQLSQLPQATVAREIEVRHLLESHRLWGMGLGWVDLHILASAAIMHWRVFTADQAMTTAAGRMNLRILEF